MTSYYLYAQAQLPPQQWTESLKRQALIKRWSKKVNPMGVFTHTGQGEGVMVEVQQILQFSKYWRTIEHLFQFHPSMKGVFHIDESLILHDGELAGITLMLRIVLALFAMEMADALLLSKDHDAVLRRRDGNLVLNSQIGFWTPFRLGQIPMPYELSALATPKREELR